MRRGEPRRRQKDPSARRGRTGDKEAPGRDEESRRRRRREDTGASCCCSRVGASSPYGEPSGQPRPGEGAPAAPELASSLRSGGRERATRQGPAAAAAPPSPALSAAPGAAAAAAAASSAPAAPPAPRKSQPRIGAPGSEGGETRDSAKPPICGGLKQSSQSFLWIKNIYSFFFLLVEEKERKTSGDLQGKKGDVTRGYVFSTPQTSSSTL